MKLRDWIDVQASASKTTKRSVLANLAYAGGVRVHTVWLISRGKRVSPGLASSLSAFTNGEVSVQELLYPEGLPAGARMVPLGEAAEVGPELAA